MSLLNSVKQGEDGQSGISGISGISGFSATGTPGLSGFSGKSGLSGWSGISGFDACCDTYIVVLSGGTQLDNIYVLTRTSPTSQIWQTADWPFSNPASAQISWTGAQWNLGIADNSGDSETFVSFSQNRCAPLVYSDDGGTLTGTPTVSVTNCYTGTSGATGGTGATGLSGASGLSGISGKIGASGFSGQSGSSGFSGIGTSGASGISGFSGAPGSSSGSGFSGASGFSGISGASGTSGTGGASGISGASGTSGISGFSGSAGSQGIQGASGTSGISGFSGSAGSQGIQGVSGSSGISGFSGISGASGVSGTSGISGFSGKSGQSGFSGTSGISGTIPNPLVEAPVTLTYGATVNTDASLGNTFYLTTIHATAASFTLANPTNSTDGQVVKWVFTQDGATPCTIALDTNFAFGTDITAFALTATASKVDCLMCIYNSAKTKWLVLATTKGF